MADEMPGLDVAYDVVQASYAQVIERTVELDALLDRWATAALSILPLVPLAILAAGRTGGLELVPAWGSILGLGVVLGTLGLVTVLAAYAMVRLRGRVYPTSPQRLLDDKWLELEPDEFKLFMIEHRATNFEKMRSAVNWKRNALLGMAAGLLLEVLGLVIWLLGAILATPGATSMD